MPYAKYVILKDGVTPECVLSCLAVAVFGRCLRRRRRRRRRRIRLLSCVRSTSSSGAAAERADGRGRAVDAGWGKLLPFASMTKLASSLG